MKKRTIMKRKGSKDETTQIVTVEEEGKQPEVTVTVTEKIPEEKKVTPKPAEELPWTEQVKLKRTPKQRELVPEEGPESVTLKPVKKEKILTEEKPVVIEELPEQVKEMVITDKGVTKKQITKKRVIKKRMYERRKC